MQAADGVYEIPREHLDLRDPIRQIVKERVAPPAAEIDATGQYPWDIRELFAEQDILGLPFAQESRSPRCSARDWAPRPRP